MRSKRAETELTGQRIVPKVPPDPMPAKIAPCLAKASSHVPSGPDWMYEIKWDGYRIALFISPDGIRVITRGGLNWTIRFPAIADSARTLGVGTAILDGEAVVLDEEGRSDFSRLQRAVGAHRFAVNTTEIVMYAFDLLYLEGNDIRDWPLEERKALLEQVLRDATGSIRFCEAIEGDGASIFNAVCELGLEGVVAKKKGGRYRSGRSKDWTKIKCLQTADFYVVGYVIAGRGISKLLLGRKEDQGLTYVGSVGSGFTRQVAGELFRSLESVREADPLSRIRGNLVRLKLPLIVATVNFRGWTTRGKLRHASFKGARVDDTGD
ncbi:non-homologous end-joining DNA ligase [Pararhizobium sp. BT-229]|uniref:non-homologous end-joining DNA ligase n=1 Tax=Pararhizobium sp. BT-229 TaxID=2986923 RepID=UPI0021F76951|nr:non-homologous end-joining DNA ligase [Pararhizobium sp. BT-229]MCV9964335.1 non-homologous end-joining DNA ligase [Pararhizobium sp. BT-229]